MWKDRRARRSGKRKVPIFFLLFQVISAPALPGKRDFQSLFWGWGAGEDKRGTTTTLGPQPPPAPEANLSRRLQQTDVDGDESIETLVREAQTLHEELQFGRAPCVFHHVTQFPSPQDVYVALAEERIWKNRRRKRRTREANIYGWV